MNARLLLAILSVAALSSCSTTYKAQTPDDVYYSPAKPQAEYVKTETQIEKDSYRYQQNDYYSADDRYLRWKVRNRQRWGAFDDYDAQWYGYNDVWSNNSYSYNRPWGNYWNSYWTWNNYYNPYCNRVIVVSPKTNAQVYNKIRTYTPGTYNNTSYNNTNVTRPAKLPAKGGYSPNNSYNNGNNSSLGNSIRKVFSNSSSSNNNSSTPSSSNDRPSRTYSPPANNSSSSGSSGSSSGGSSGGSGGGGGTSRPNRGG